MEIRIFVATYVDDEYADEYGSKVFADEDAARAWADTYRSEAGEGAQRYCTVEAHTIRLRLVDGSFDGET